MWAEILCGILWLVIGSNDARTVWDVKPEPAQVEPGSQILPYEPENKNDNPNDYIRGIGDRAVKKKPPAPPPPTPQEQAEAELNAALDKAADDDKIALELWVQIYRASKITDPVKKMNVWRQLKQVNPQLQVR